MTDTLTRMGKTTYRARLVVTMNRGIVDNGRVTICEGRIVSVSTDAVSGEVDLGNAALLPGWVNAHTHLEFSSFRQPLGFPGIPLASWIQRVVCHRLDQSPDSPEDKHRVILQGWQEATGSGTVLLGDIWQRDAPPTFIPVRAGLQRLVAFYEVRGLSPHRAAESLRSAESWSAALCDEAMRIGLSPHAPYSCTPASVVACVRLARRWNLPLAMHLAESPDEETLTLEGKGPFAETLKQLGFWTEGVFPNGHSIPDWLRLLGEGPLALVVHGNYLKEPEMEILAQLPRVSVVYCPRTHAYFRHPPHPVGRLLRCGIRVALGTDSRASNPDLDLGNEVRYLLSHRQDLSPEVVLRMATLSGAEALGEPNFGKIEPGSSGQMLVLPLTTNQNRSHWEWLAESMLENAVTLSGG